MRLFKQGSSASEVLADQNLGGKCFFLTGCSSGLGLETMRALCARGAKVIGTARDLDKARIACNGVDGDAAPLACDLSNAKSIRDAIAAADGEIDCIIANAGVMALPVLQRYHDVEAHFFVNHIGHFIVVNGLLDRLSPHGRVVFVASGAHAMASRGIALDDLGWRKRRYSPWAAYAHSKLANILCSNELARRLGPGQASNALHPGLVDTGLWRHLSADDIRKVTRNATLRPASECAAAVCHLAAHADSRNVSGGYITDNKIGKPSAIARDGAAARRLWQVSEDLCRAI